MEEDNMFLPEEQGFEVWIRVDDNYNVIEVNSNIFIRDYNGWIKIAEHIMGDKGAHAQSQYFDKSLMNEEGQFNYKYEKGEIIENKG